MEKNFNTSSSEAALTVLSELARLIAEGADAAGLIEALAGAMKCVAVLEDVGLTQLGVGLEALLKDKESILPYLSIGSSPAFKNVTDVRRLTNKPIRLEDNSPGMTVYRLAVSVSAGGEQLGILSLLRTDRPFDDDEASVLSHAASLVAVFLAQQKRTSEIELRLKGNFVDDLVSLRYSEPESIMSRARALDFNPALPHRVLVGNIENIGQLMSHIYNDAKAAAKFWTELAGRIQTRLDGAGGGMVIHKNDELILLVSEEKPDSPIGPSKKLAEEIISDLETAVRAKLFIGIGKVTSVLSDYQESYLEAKKALDIGAYMITEGQVRSFEQFRVHALFLSTLKPAELYDYARSQLGVLLDYDDKHRTELLKTLQEFLYLRNNVEGTAKSLNMSVSGLKYRLQKIEQIIGLNLGDYKVSFDLQLALVILQLFGEYRIRNI